MYSTAKDDWPVEPWWWAPGKAEWSCSWWRWSHWFLSAASFRWTEWGKQEEKSEENRRSCGGREAGRKEKKHGETAKAEKERGGGGKKWWYFCWRVPTIFICQVCLTPDCTLTVYQNSEWAINHTEEQQSDVRLLPGANGANVHNSSGWLQPNHSVSGVHMDWGHMGGRKELREFPINLSATNKKTVNSFLV